MQPSDIKVGQKWRSKAGGTVTRVVGIQDGDVQLDFGVHRLWSSVEGLLRDWEPVDAST